MIVTVTEVMKDDNGKDQEHRLSVRHSNYNGSTIEYTGKRAALIVSLGQDTIILRTHIDNAVALRSLENKLVEAIKREHDLRVVEALADLKQTTESMNNRANAL